MSENQGETWASGVNKRLGQWKAALAVLLVFFIRQLWSYF